MAQYGIIYRLSWNTVPSIISSTVTQPAQALEVNIYDTSVLIEDSDSPTVIQLQAGANPLVIKIINNDEDKFSPIRAKQALIEFISKQSQLQDATTFADSYDNRWYVVATADGEFIFKGFLMLSDCQQDFLPDPNVVQLTASDHLGLLKDLPLTDDDNLNPEGRYTIGELIALCLKGTGLSLPIRVVNNLRHGSGSLSGVSMTFSVVLGINTITFTGNSDFFYFGQRLIITGTASNDGTYTVLGVGVVFGIVFVSVSESITPEDTTGGVQDETSLYHFYKAIYLDALTYENGIGVSEDRYTVLTKILGEDCFLTQWKGYWYIMRIDEYDGNPIYVANFDQNGLFVSFDPAGSFSKSIGASETRRLANADALLRFDRPSGAVKENFSLDAPEEIICNLDYSMGDETSDVDVQRSGYTAYELNCWFPGRLWGSALTTPTFESSIQRAFSEFGDETQRFIMLTQPASPTGAFEYIRSTGFPVSIRDKFTFSFDARAMATSSGDGEIFVCMIILYGIDGSAWILNPGDLSITWDNTLGEIPTQWKESADVDISTFRDGLRWAIFDDADHPNKTEWASFIMAAAPVPIDGDVYIHLFSANQQAGTYDDFDINYQNLELNYYPYIGGLYSKYKKFYHKVSRDPIGYFNNKREKDVFIADTLKSLFKGTMLFPAGSTEVFSGSIVFVHSNNFTISGDHTAKFRRGQRLRVTGTSSNDGDYLVVDVNLILLGPFTQVILFQQTIVNETVSCTVGEIRFARTVKWWTSHVFALGPPPDQTYTHAYGFIQVYSVWNQYLNANRILSTSILGLGSMWPDALDKFSLTDSNTNTDNRYFLLISFEQNWKTALWSGVFIEDYRTDIAKDYLSPHELKYLTK